MTLEQEVAMRNRSPSRAPEQKLARIQLVARAQVAYEQMVDAVRRYGSDPAGRRRIDVARQRLAALNLALALLALHA
jgi:hypothetical protein